MKVHCDVTGEYIDEEDCYSCEEYCEKKRKTEERNKQREEEIKRLRSSALANKIKQTLAKSLNLQDEEIDNLIIRLFDGAFRAAEDEFKTCLCDLARKKAIEYIKVKAKKHLDKIFEEAINNKVLILAKDEKAQETKIQKIILNRAKKFFDEQNSYNNRNKISESLDSAIEKAVSAKVAIALNEIKEESIKKFNKEAMKKMMMSMVGAIQNDKRLLAVLDPS